MSIVHAHKGRGANDFDIILQNSASNPLIPLFKME